MSTLRKDQHTFLIISRSLVLRMKNVSDKRYRENQNILITVNNISFSKIVLFMRYVETYWREGQAADDNLAHEYCWIPKPTYTHTHMGYLKNSLLFHCNNGFMNASHCYVLRAFIT